MFNILYTDILLYNSFYFRLSVFPERFIGVGAVPLLVWSEVCYSSVQGN